MKSTLITGYRDLSDDDIGVINTIKEAELQLGTLWEQVGQYAGVDARWLAIAKTHFQEGFMAFVRAVAQPEDAF